MKPRMIFAGVLVLFLGLLLPGFLSAQVGNISIADGAEITVPLGATLCADTIFANNPGYGTLNYPNANSICRAVVIPVELITFSAVMQNGVVILSWSTATENSNHGFEVQRKTEAGEWSAVGFVPGHGNTTQQQYYGLADPLEDLPTYCCALYYRLRQIDHDGSAELSPVVEIRLDQPLPQFSLYCHPSPCDESLTVRFSLPETRIISIRLHDISGRVVTIIAQDALLPAGSQSLRVRTKELPSGLYLLVVESQEGRRTEKVVIRH